MPQEVFLTWQKEINKTKAIIINSCSMQADPTIICGVAMCTVLYVTFLKQLLKSQTLRYLSSFITPREPHHPDSLFLSGITVIIVMWLHKAKLK